LEGGGKKVETGWAMEKLLEGGGRGGTGAQKEGGGKKGLGWAVTRVGFFWKREGGWGKLQNTEARKDRGPGGKRGGSKMKCRGKSETDRGKV